MATETCNNKTYDNILVPNKRLYVANLPRSYNKVELVEKFGKLTTGLENVIVYSSHTNTNRQGNNGFCYLDYKTHTDAAYARGRLGGLKLSNHNLTSDWADPHEEPDTEILFRIRKILIKNLSNTITEQLLKVYFQPFGLIQMSKIIDNFGIITYNSSQSVIKAIQAMNGNTLRGNIISITLGKPPFEQKIEEAIKRERDGIMVPRITTKDKASGNGEPIQRVKKFSVFRSSNRCNEADRKEYANRSNEQGDDNQSDTDSSNKYQN